MKTVIEMAAWYWLAGHQNSTSYAPSAVITITKLVKGD
jgi:hypothetical protein